MAVATSGLAHQQNALADQRISVALRSRYAYTPWAVASLSSQGARGVRMRASSCHAIARLIKRCRSSPSAAMASFMAAIASFSGW